MARKRPNPLKREVREFASPEPPTAARRRIMQAIRGRGNRTTEIRLSVMLRAYGLRGWRRHAPLPGRPDFVWPHERVAVFVDGCFWHGCPKCYRPPSKNTAFWRAKLESNRHRDRRVSRQLRAQGWKVLRIWECRLDEGMTIRRLRSAVEQSSRRESLSACGRDANSGTGGVERSSKPRRRSR